MYWGRGLMGPGCSTSQGLWKGSERDEHSGSAACSSVHGHNTGSNRGFISARSIDMRWRENEEERIRFNGRGRYAVGSPNSFGLSRSSQASRLSPAFCLNTSSVV